MKDKCKGVSLRRGIRWWCVAVAVWSLLPLVNGIVNGVVLLPSLALGAAWLFLRRMPPVKQAKGWRKGMWIAAIAVACAVALLATAVSALMIHAAAAPPREGATVIVLGSKIYGDRPSRMMRQRLDAAAARLEADPAAHCVVTGGLGEGETYTEAYVMKKYLVEQKGIAPDRIACEDYATDTHENMALSMALIREKGWSTDVVVATQVFHQYRARQLAFASGADSVGGAACLSPVHLMLYYWVRECAAVCRLWLTGY
ncbi:MAG: YdcF family protein [Clostridia bacterium]|nr:YdcF family protein [Clostridia bacterium]